MNAEEKQEQFALLSCSFVSTIVFTSFGTSEFKTNALSFKPTSLVLSNATKISKKSPNLTTNKQE